MGGLDVEPRSEIVVGARVCVVARLLAWVACPSEVVEVIDEPRRFSFVYRTLDGHPMRGEERFTVDLGDDGTVWYDVSSISRPDHPAVWLLLPAVRRMQRRFAGDSAEAMRSAVSADLPA
jgi:uncharacterized protein (UPF0548 family)